MAERDPLRDEGEVGERLVPVTELVVDFPVREVQLPHGKKATMTGMTLQHVIDAATQAGVSLDTMLVVNILNPQTGQQFFTTCTALLAGDGVSYLLDARMADTYFDAAGDKGFL